MRIVSLVPAATEIAYSIGAGDDLVAATHDCDFPPAARALPRVTRSLIPVGSTSAEIDRLVRTAAADGDSTFHLDAEALAAAEPDVLLGQTLCEVCAVTIAQLPRFAGRSPAVVPLDGHSIEGIFVDIVRAGAALGHTAEAASLVTSLRERLARVHSAVAATPRTRVACLEWVAPLFNAGHWVPEQVALAGGEELLGRPLVPSVEIGLDRLIAADPDVVVLMPCGFDAERAVRESIELRALPEWLALRAARAGAVYAVDGNAYFSRPGPRVVDGVELLASILHPDLVAPSRSALRLSGAAVRAWPEIRDADGPRRASG